MISWNTRLGRLELIYGIRNLLRSVPHAGVALHGTSRCHADGSHSVSANRNSPRNLLLIQWLLDGILRVLHKHLRLGRSRHCGVPGCSCRICWSLTCWLYRTRLWDVRHVFLTPLVDTLERAFEALGHGVYGSFLTCAATGNP